MKYSLVTLTQENRHRIILSENYRFAQLYDKK